MATSLFRASRRCRPGIFLRWQLSVLFRLLPPHREEPADAYSDCQRVHCQNPPRHPLLTVSAPTIRGGILAGEQLRQRKNMFIVTVALVSQAAIRGGMDVDDAFSYSDSYIQQCELLSSPEAITNLQYRMLLDYTERAERLRSGRQPTKLTLDVANYIQHHMSERITAERIAEALFLSRPYLSRRFKQETGESLTDFIMKEKTEEARRLLRYSDKSLTAIANYLGFSSPGHFSRVFRKYASMNPGEYRLKYISALSCQSFCPHGK